MKKKRSNVASPLSEKSLMELFTIEEKPLRLDDIFRILHIERRQKHTLLELLGALVAQKKLIPIRGGGWTLVSALKTASGRLEIVRSGMGFVILDQQGGKVPDIAVSQNLLAGAWHGDTVRVALLPVTRGRKPEGRVIEILEHAHQDLVVRVLRLLDEPQKRGKPSTALCQPADARLEALLLVSVPEKETGQQKTPFFTVGELLVVQPEYPLQANIQEHLPKGHAGEEPLNALFVRSLGTEDSVSVQEQLVKINNRVPEDFPPEVLTQAEAFSEEPNSADFKGRRDLSKLPFVTIDGHTARDFDDAILVEQTAEGWCLYVAIADVTHYMQPNSPLDKEAQTRSNSWYFPRSVEPMLPEKLSNGLCSLNPQVPRLVMVAEMHFSPQGNELSSTFYAGVIRSQARLTYGQIQRALLLDDHAEQERLAPLLPMLRQAEALARSLRTMRDARGSLDFQQSEPEYHFDDQGVLTLISRKERHFGHQMIEECMIAANEAVARFLAQKGVPFLYRAHPEPDPERLASLWRTLSNTGLAPHLPVKASAQLLPQLLEQARVDAQEAARHARHLAEDSTVESISTLVDRLVLRSMMQARYQPEAQGHFGLASSCYCHFTSPIRRYADVVVHRALKYALGLDRAAIPDEKALQGLADILNKHERQAQDAEREIARRLGLLFMRGHINENFSGIIAGVTDFGFFVELDAYPVEGMVRVLDLTQDYFSYDQDRQELLGQNTGQRYRLGQSVQVQVHEANLSRLELTLQLQGSHPGKPGHKPGRTGRPDRSRGPAPNSRGARNGFRSQPRSTRNTGRSGKG